MGDFVRDEMFCRRMWCVIGLLTLACCGIEGQNASTDESFARLFPDIQLPSDSGHDQAKDASQSLIEALTDGLQSESGLRVAEPYVALHKTAVGRPLLLTPAIAHGAQAPILEFGQPKKVMFVRQGMRLALVQTNQASLQAGLPTQRLIQTFDIHDETSDEILFSWDKGLSTIGLREPFVVQDLPATVDAFVLPQEPVLHVRDAFVLQMRAQNQGLFVHQIARVENTQWALNMLEGGGIEGTDISQSVHIYFNLEPVRTNPTFTSKPTHTENDIGFFQVAVAQPKRQEKMLYATRWDLHPARLPLIYRVADNVPTHLKSAVVEGIEYWNRIAQKKIIEVKFESDLAAIAQPGETFLHWVPWDELHAARSSLQPDPDTGEILRADIYIPSLFLDVGNKQWMQALTQASTNPVSKPKTLTESQLGCVYDGVMAAQGELLLVQTASNDQRAQIALGDFMRGIVAHEVGHTLGLRHNFAASLQSEIADAKSHTQIWQNYVGDETHTGACVGTSVMDYYNSEDSFLLGAHIKEHVLDYDSKAFLWAYGQMLEEGEPVEQAHAEPQKKLLYCSDGDYLNHVLGCRPFDSGQNPLDGYVESIRARRDLLPYAVIQTLIQALPKAQQQVQIDELQLKKGLDTLYLVMATQARPVFDILAHTHKILVNLQTSEQQQALEAYAYRDVAYAQIRTWFDQIGGLPTFLYAISGMANDSNLLDYQDGWLKEAVEHILSTTAFCQNAPFDCSGAGALNEEQINAIRTWAPQAATLVEQRILRDFILVLTGELPASDGASSLDGMLRQFLNLLMPRSQITPALVDAAWLPDIETWVEFVVMAEKPTFAEQKEQVLFPEPLFEESTRLVALRLLSSDLFGLAGWGIKARERLSAALQQRMGAALFPAPERTPLWKQWFFGAEPKRYVLPSDEKTIQRWFQTESRVLRGVHELDANRSAIPGAVTAAQSM